MEKNSNFKCLQITENQPSEDWNVEKILSNYESPTYSSSIFGILYTLKFGQCGGT